MRNPNTNINPDSTTKKQKRQSVPKTRFAAVRDLYDPQDGSLLDQSLILVFQGPKSFTGEDIVELHCHGSRAVVKGILEALGALGQGDESDDNHNTIRPADRGEFTQRAFDNGKLNLLEVEALADLIVADTSLQRKQALKQLGGNLSKLYDAWRAELTKGLAHAEAVIDFGDDEDLSPADNDTNDDDDNDNDNAQEDVWGGVRHKITTLRKAMERHLSDKERGEIVRDGVRVAIVGPPNAGKSSLLNILAQRDAAIVSPIAGTTRDVVEVVMDLGGVRCIVSDTAGVRTETVDIVEMEGIRRARVAASQSHVAVIVLDAAEGNSIDSDSDAGIEAISSILLPPSQPKSEDDDNNDDDNHDEDDDNVNHETMIRNRQTLFVANKVDLLEEDASKDTVLSLAKRLSSMSSTSKMPLGSFGISCANGDGVEPFIDALTSIVVERVSMSNDNDDDNDDNHNNAEEAVITRSRHRRHVQDCVAALTRFEQLSGQGFMAVDMAAEELRLATTELGRVVGAIDVEDILDVLFADFCIGK
jgi:tRNA modification GTPase